MAPKKKQIDLRNEAERLMSLKSMQDMEELSSTMKQFLFRFLDVRDLDIFSEFKKYLENNDVFQAKIANKVFDRFETTLQPLLENLEKNQKSIASDVTMIKDKVHEIEESVENIKNDPYIKSMRKRWMIVSITLVFMGLAIIANFFIGQHKRDELDKKIDNVKAAVENIGVPIPMRARGGAIPSDLEIKYFPKDFTGDSTKTEKNAK